MRTTLLIAPIQALLYGCVSPTNSAAPDLSPPSLSEMKTVAFGSKTFVLKSHKDGLWEYFPEKESVDAWTEMLDFTVVSRGLSWQEPLDLGKRTVQLHQLENPNMPAILTTDNRTGVLYLMLFYPKSIRKDGDYSEISFFKYYRDSVTGQIIIFHFARNIPTPANPSESTEEMGAELVPTFKAFPLYRQ